MQSVPRPCRYTERKGGTAVAVIKSIPHNDVDLPPLVSVEACLFVIVKYCLQLIINPPVGPGSDADITELSHYDK
jgi:hypothetical protein